jgi:hypothetical protein
VRRIENSLSSLEEMNREDDLPHHPRISWGKEASRKWMAKMGWKNEIITRLASSLTMTPTLYFIDPTFAHDWAAGIDEFTRVHNWLIIQIQQWFDIWSSLNSQQQNKYWFCAN